MITKSKSKRTFLYVIILIIGLILALRGPGPDSRFGKQSESIDLEEGAEFIVSRSRVTYRLVEDLSIDRINQMFGLRLKKEILLRLNEHLDEKQVDQKIPKGTELNLMKD
jgi:hypothetical protein